MSVAEKILDQIILQGMVNVAHPDPDECHVFVWNANTIEQLDAVVRNAVCSCSHPPQSIMVCGPHCKWCSKCGAVIRVMDGLEIGSWEYPEVV